MPREREVLPAMPLLVRDWLTGDATKRMTPAQRGAFTDLLAHAWGSNPPCTLPDDDNLLAVWSGLFGKWKKEGAFVKEQFRPIGDGLLRNPKQWEVYSDLIERRSRRQLGADKTNAQRYAKDTAQRTAQRDAHGCASRVATANADVSSVAEEPESGEKPLTPQQAAVGAVIDAMSECACGFVTPPPPRIAKWNQEFGSDFVVSVIRDVGAGLDGKGASYLQAILRDRSAAGWRPRSQFANRELSVGRESGDENHRADLIRDTYQDLAASLRLYERDGEWLCPGVGDATPETARLYVAHIQSAGGEARYAKTWDEFRGANS